MRLWPTLLLATLAAMPLVSWATPTKAKIAIIIDDLGYNWQQGLEAISLPGAVTLSILPHAPQSARLAEVAQSQQKEIMIHLPMASVDPEAAMEPDSLQVDQSEQAVRRLVDQALAALPQSVGFNNHMGSLATSNSQLMNWVMSQAKQQNLYFIDSRTTVHTKARFSAEANGLGNLERDLFLDADPDSSAVEASFQRLVALATRRGYAIGIAHPYPTTLRVLRRELAQLDSRVTTVPVSSLIEQYGLPVSKPTLDLRQLGRWLSSMPVPVSQRLNFSN